MNFFEEKSWTKQGWLDFGEIKISSTFVISQMTLEIATSAVTLTEYKWEESLFLLLFTGRQHFLVYTASLRDELWLAV